MNSSIGSTYGSELIKKKPTLVIKKSSLFKANSVFFIKTPTKRSSTQETTALYDVKAKKKCPEFNIEEQIAVSIINKIKPETSNVAHINTNGIEKESDDLDDAPSNQENVDPFIVEAYSEVAEAVAAVPSKNKERPMKRCENHNHLPEYQAEGLVKVNDEFESIEEFVNYTYAHAKHWCFYYKIGGSNQRKLQFGKRNLAKYTPTIYSFDCIFLKKRESQSKGIRKVSVFRETSCQARVVLKRRYGEDVFKVTHACHHHDHRLTPEEFLKVPNAHRLSPAMKKEIDELLAFNLETPLLKQYVLSETGMDLRKNVANRYQAVKRSERDKIMQEMTPERMKIILEKIKDIRANFVIPKNKEVKEGSTPKKGKRRVSVKHKPHYEDTHDEEPNSFESQNRADFPATLVQSCQYSSDEKLSSAKQNKKHKRRMYARRGGRSNKLVTSTPMARSKPKQPSLWRISQDITDEIRDLAWFGLDAEIIRRHIYFETGKDLIKPILCIIEETVNKATKPLELRQDTLDDILEKIRHLEDKYGSAEINNWLSHKKKIDMERIALKSMKNINSPSRVETRLNNIMSDQQLIDSVEELKRTTGCNIQIQEVDNRPLELEVVNEIEIEYIDNEDNGNENISNTHDTVEEYTSNEHDTVEEYISNEHDDVGKYYNNEDDGEEYIISNDEQNAGEEYISNEHDIAEEHISNEHNADEDYIIISNEHDAGDEYMSNAPNINEEYISNENDPNVEYISNANSAGEEYISNENNAGNKYISYAHNIGEEHNSNENDASEEFINNEHDLEEKYTSMEHDAGIEYSSKVDDAGEEYVSNEHGAGENYADNASGRPTANTDNCELRDVAVQAEFELLVLESNYESIQKTESVAISEGLKNCKYSSSTRGPPKNIEEEAIINKFNIELYISNFTGITTCLENISANMNLSIIELLKKIYKGEGVFKMIMGRSGQQNRITVQLTYVPLTITFPYEKFKYINSLQEYKAMCSKYLDLAMNLEKVVGKLSSELRDKDTEESQSDQFARLQQEKENNYAQSKQIAQLQKALQESNARLKGLERKKIVVRKKYDQDIIGSIDIKEEEMHQSTQFELQRDIYKAVQLSVAQSEEIEKLKKDLKELALKNDLLYKNNNRLTKRNMELEEHLNAKKLRNLTIYSNDKSSF